jgi:hypothetical protein
MKMMRLNNPQNRARPSERGVSYRRHSQGAPGACRSVDYLSFAKISSHSVDGAAGALATGQRTPGGILGSGLG